MNRSPSPAYRLLLLLLLLALGLCGGCAAKQKNSGDSYQTVRVDPRRDIATAKEQNQRGLELLAKGKLQEAQAAFKAALEADVTYAPAHNNLGRLYFQHQNYYLAAWEFQYTIKLLPNQPEPYNNLGLVYEAVGKLSEATENYRKALEWGPDNPQYIGNLARVLLRQGQKTDQVRQLLQKLVERDTRPQWVGWAREQLSRWPKGNTN